MTDDTGAMQCGHRLPPDARAGEIDEHVRVGARGGNRKLRMKRQQEHDESRARIA
jgi:hypothetical protein